MATSKILYMKDCGNAYHGKHLKLALDYITVPEKTQGQRLVGGVNCQPEFAFLQMKETKQKFGKMDKRQGYHLILSFVENEVDADTVFELTERFVKEYLGSRFEAVYAVHDNTYHIHSHIIYNSVSFLDGKKYRYEKGDWAKEIQPITNRLCQEYGLSTIDIEDERTRPNDNYREWNDYRDGPFVWSDMIARDMDIAIVQAESYEQFLHLLQEKGYELKQGKYLSARPPGMKRFKRCKSIGENYCEERIRERIPLENISNYKTESLEEAERIIYAKIPRGKRAKLSGIQKKYYARLYKIGLMKRRPYSQAWKYKDDIRKMHKLQEQYLFLVNHDIETAEQLISTTYNLTDKKKQVTTEKSKVFKARKKCESLFQMIDTMKEVAEGEKAFTNGDDFFIEEHQEWENLASKLYEQGYSYEEVLQLKEHYRSEIARVRDMEKAVLKELRIAESIRKELTESSKEKEENLEKKQKNTEQKKTQPSR